MRRIGECDRAQHRFLISENVGRRIYIYYALAIILIASLILAVPINVCVCFAADVLFLRQTKGPQAEAPVRRVCVSARVCEFWGFFFGLSTCFAFVALCVAIFGPLVRSIIFPLVLR